MLTYSDVLSAIEDELADNDNIKASRHKKVNELILDFTKNHWLPGDIMEIDCNNNYIGINFDGNGKGKVGGDREGWQICNGNNGTKNRTGRVSVGYGSSPAGWVSTDFSSIGPNNYTPVYGGQKDAVVVEHTHTFKTRGGIGDAEDKSGTRRELIVSVDSTHTTSNAVGGVPGTDKNLQPYIVTLFIQKL